MEANGKSYRTIKNELKETFYMGQIQGSEILRPNYLIISKNYRTSHKKPNKDRYKNQYGF